MSPFPSTTVWTILFLKPSKCIWNCPYTLGCWLCQPSITLPLMNSFSLSQKPPTAYSPLARHGNSCLTPLSIIGFHTTWACASLKHASSIKCCEYIWVTAMLYLQNTVSWDHLLLLSLRTFYDLLWSSLYLGKKEWPINALFRTAYSTVFYSVPLDQLWVSVLINNNSKKLKESASLMKTENKKNDIFW